MTKRWYKKDLKTLKQQINTFRMQNGLYYSEERISAFIEEHKQDVVVSNLTAFKNHLDARAQESQETSYHYKKVTWGSEEHRAEMVERFQKLADGDNKAVARIDGLLQRISEEGLPKEVLEYTGLEEE